MRNLRRVTLCLMPFLFVISVCAEAAAQEIRIVGPGDPIQMPGMGPRQFKTGTSRIRGRVISAEAGAPVRRAQLRLSGPDIGSKTALTDAEGRYEFRELPAGRFNLSATKSGYVTMQYGQTRPFESGKPIELADAQVLEKADVHMPRGSVISGRILDEFGDPVADANVSAMRSAWSNGRRRMQPAGRNAQTNDLGQYRIYGLPPGDYYINATFRGGEMMMMEGLAMASIRGDSGASGSAPASGYAPTYFPGTSSGAEAQKLALAVGQEAQGTDFALLPVRLARITGTVISSDGKPIEGSMVSADPRGGDGAMPAMPMLGGSTSRTDKNGNFTLANVAPGDYTLQTRGMSITTSSSGGDTMMFTTRIVGGPGGEGGDTEVGSVPLSVNGDDVTGVVILTAKGATLTGRLNFEGGSKPAGGSIRIMASPLDNDNPVFSMGGSGVVKADGSFELKGVAGQRLVRPVGLPPGWTLKSVKLNGADVTDTGIDVKAGQAIDGLEVSVSSQQTEVSGSVKGSDGQPVKDYTVVIFSDDEQKWMLPRTRYVAGTRPTQEGRFQVKNLPAGSYYAVAVEYIAQGEWGDPELLDRLKDKASKFTLGDGDTKTLDLKMQ